MYRVLVAEDDLDIRELVQYKLKVAGIDVVAVADGTTALSVILTDPPDLCILDVMMPGMTGTELCESLRRRPETARIPIILLTAKAQESDIRSGLASGADEYIAKPFSPKHLLSRVETLLRDRREETGRDR